MGVWHPSDKGDICLVESLNPFSIGKNTYSTLNDEILSQLYFYCI